MQAATDRYASQPMLFSELMIKLSSALTDAINAIDQESGSGVGDVGRQLQNKFKGWRDEVDGVSRSEETHWTLLNGCHRCARGSRWMHRMVRAMCRGTRARMAVSTRIKSST